MNGIFLGKKYTNGASCCWYSFKSSRYRKYYIDLSDALDQLRIDEEMNWANCVIFNTNSFSKYGLVHMYCNRNN